MSEKKYLPWWFIPSSVGALGFLGTALGEWFSGLRVSCGPKALLKVEAFCNLASRADSYRVSYEAFRAFALAQPLMVGAGAVALTVGASLAYRQTAIALNRLEHRARGNQFEKKSYGIPRLRFNFEKELLRRKPGELLVGFTRGPGWLGRLRPEPIYMNEDQRSMHRHVIGKTGSGKTLGVMWPAVWQDMIDGRGVVVMDAKGSDESLKTFLSLAKATGRLHQARVFCLPAMGKPSLFSHTYSLTHVPKGEGNCRAEVIRMADRLLTVLPLSPEVYYFGQSTMFLQAVCRLFHGGGTANGEALPFSVPDLIAFIRGIGLSDKSAYGRAHARMMDHPGDAEAALMLKNQFQHLDHKAFEALTGLLAALEQFTSPLVNASAPDIVMEELLETDGLLYVQLPGNLYPKQARTLGRAMLIDLQQAAALRQVERESRNQNPFSVYIDEFYNFADQSIIDGINKLRDARIEYTLLHQSMADLTRVSPDFAQQVWDNTLTKEVLRQDSPELCERIARSLGTVEGIEQTIRKTEGPLWSAMWTADASNKLVETLILHPNALKAIKRPGTGYHLFGPERVFPIVYPQLSKKLVGLKASPPPGNDQSKARGLRLHENYILGDLRT